MKTKVGNALRESFASTAGGEAGLLEAASEALAECAHQNLATSELARLEDALIREVQEIRGRITRDPLGLVLTPTAVASGLVDLIERVFPGTQLATDTVLDPAAGTGRLLDAWGERSTAERYGWDLDQVPLTTAHTLSTLRGRANRSGGLHLSEVDGLAEPRPSNAGRLTVLANPPFVAAFSRRSQAAEMDDEQLRHVAQGWTSGRLNTAVAFVARVVRDLLHPGEVAGFVLPDAILSASQYGATRRAWLAFVDVFHVGRLDESAFPRHGLRSVLVVCRRRAMSAFDSVVEPHVQSIAFSMMDEDGWRAAGSLPISAVEASECSTIPWPSAVSELAFKLLAAGHRLDRRFTVSDGVNPGTAVARAALVSDTPSTLQKARPVLEGRNIGPGTAAPNTKWIETEPSKLLPEWRRAGTSLRAPGLFDGPRCYSRQTSDRLVFAYVDDQTMALNSVHVTKWAGNEGEAQTALNRLTAILNCELVTEVYQALFAEDRRLFPQVKIRNLRALPLPWPAPPNVNEAADRWVENPSVPRLRHVNTMVGRWLEAVAESATESK
ncbi:MAG: putative RNA methylase [Bradymonadia bacterium]|jgi:predicted RNA methylase